MPDRHFSHGKSTFFCHACHKETRDTGRGEENSGLCWTCYQINEQENLHLDDAHEADFGECKVCQLQMPPHLVKRLPYYLGEKSYLTI